MQSKVYPCGGNDYPSAVCMNDERLLWRIFTNGESATIGGRMISSSSCRSNVDSSDTVIERSRHHVATYMSSLPATTAMMMICNDFSISIVEKDYGPYVMFKCSFQGKYKFT